MRLVIHDWRSGSTPRRDFIDFLLENKWFETEYDLEEEHNTFLINIPNENIGDMLDKATEKWDIAFMVGHLCIDTKNYKFTQR